MQYRMNLNPAFWGRLAAFNLATLGYVWFLLILHTYHALVKYFSLQAYFVFWIYYLLHLSNSFMPLSSGMVSFRDSMLKIGLAVNAVVAFGYFLLIRPYMTKHSLSTLGCNDYIHTVPLIVFAAQFWVNNQVRFLPTRDFQMVIAYLVGSIAINATYSLIEKPVYKFLTFRDVQSCLLVVAYILVVLGAYYLCFLIDQKKQGKKIQVIERQANKE